MAKGLRVLTSSACDDWCTPPSLLTKIRQFSITGEIGLDPCGNRESHVNAVETFGPGFGKRDGLNAPWCSNGLVFVNPPYSQIRTWMEKVAYEAGAHQFHEFGPPEILCLVPARVDTRWWHESVCDQAQCVLFFKGRLKFIDPTREDTTSAPFPSALILYTPDRQRILQFETTFAGLGSFWRHP